MAKYRAPKNRDVFDLINKQNRGGGWQPKPRPISQNAGIRTQQDAGPEQYGQDMTGPGYVSGSEAWIDYNIGSAQAGGDSFMETPGGNINNMNDLYDWYQANVGSNPALQGFDSFMDWFNYQNNWMTDMGFEFTGFTPYPSSSMYAPVSGSSPSQQGGLGDLGTGSNFAGGGMASSMFGEGITNPFGEGWGPEGQIAGDDSWVPDFPDDSWGETPGGGSDWNPYGEICLEMYQESGAVDDYDTWASIYCG